MNPRGKVPPLKMLSKETVPFFKVHVKETVPPFKMQPRGTKHFMIFFISEGYRRYLALYLTSCQFISAFLFLDAYASLGPTLSLTQ